MKVKKIIEDTVGISIGGVGISQANALPSPYGGLVGTSMSAGMVLSVGDYKKRR